MQLLLLNIGNCPPHAEAICLKSDIPTLGGEKSYLFFPPPAIFEHQSDVMEYFYEFLGRDDEAIKGFKFFISPVSTSLNSF